MSPRQDENAELLTRVETTFAETAREKGLRLRVIPSGAWIRSDFILLERILFNLVSNAVRAHNVLVDERSGRVRGVIDWDLSCEAAPTFVDALHWEVRGAVRDVEAYFDVLERRVAALHRAPGEEPGAEPDWWRRSLFAHLVYGVWYNLRLVPRLGEERLAVAARLLAYAPEPAAAEDGVACE